MLSENVIDFLQSMGGSMLCTRSADNQPAACEMLWAEVAPHHVIGMVPAHLGAHLPVHFADNTDVSVVTSQTYGDHRSVQVKGTIADLEGPRVFDRSDVGEWFLNTVKFFPQFPPEDVARVLIDIVGCPVFRITIEVSDVFDQTPGPKAGASIGAST